MRNIVKNYMNQMDPFKRSCLDLSLPKVNNGLPAAEQTRDVSLCGGDFKETYPSKQSWFTKLHAFKMVIGHGILDNSSSRTGGSCRDHVPISARRLQNLKLP